MGRMPYHRPLALLGAITLAAGAVLACKAGTDPHLADFGGTWQYTESYADVQHSITCADVGTYSLEQAGPSFVGSYFQRGLCQEPAGVFDNTDSGTVTQGHVVGRTLTFRAPNCAYDGALDTTSGTSIAGHVVCALTYKTQQLNFSGTWQANR